MSIPQWITPAPLPLPDLNGCGIFRWLIGQETYVGRATNFADSLAAYERNFSRIEKDEAYRPQDIDGFREVHRKLHDAKSAGCPIIWIILEVCGDPKHLAERKAFWVEILAPTLNGAKRGAGRTDA